MKNSSIISKIPLAIVLFLSSSCTLLQAAWYENVANEETFLNALIGGDKEAMEDHLERRFSLNVSIQGKGPLYHAVENGHEALVPILLEKKANPYAITEQAETHLHAAAASGNENLLRYFINLGLNPNALTLSKETPLHYAVKCGHALVPLLLEAGALLYQDTNGITPMVIAVIKDSMQLVTALLDTYTKGNKQPVPLIYYALKNGKKTMAAFLKDKGLLNEGNEQGQTALIYATKRGEEALVRELLNLGADIRMADNNGDTALHAAVGSSDDSHYALATVLMNSQAPIDIQNKKKESPLHVAAIAGNSRAIALILQNGGMAHCVDEKSNVPLFYAAATTEEGTLQLLEPTKGIQNTSLLSTALLNAVYAEKESIVRSLLEGGALPNHQDTLGRTALHIAIEKRSPSLVLLLVLAGAQPSIATFAADPYGRRMTAIQYVAFLQKQYPQEQVYRQIAQILAQHDSSCSII